MLTRLEIDGFKSLRDFEIDLEPLTVLVGPNGAGKSNILEALGLISRLGEHRPEEALKLGRGRASKGKKACEPQATQAVVTASASEARSLAAAWAPCVRVRRPGSARQCGAAQIRDRRRVEGVVVTQLRRLRRVAPSVKSAKEMRATDPGSGTALPLPWPIAPTVNPCQFSVVCVNVTEL